MRYEDGFGKSSSRVVLGTTYFGDGIGEEDAFLLMDRFREQGGTHIDTARLYAGGKAEEIVGRWRKTRNANEMLIASKGGFPADELPTVMRLSEKEIREDLEQSLTALQTDVIDFYWFHRDDETIPAGYLVELMNQLQKEGKIKKFGASNWKASRIAQAQTYAEEHGLNGFFASQIRFSPACLNAPMFGLVGMDKDEFSYYQKAEMPVVAYSSQAKGFFSKLDALGEKGLSPKAKERYLSSVNLATLKTIQELAVKYQVSVAAVICGAFCSIKTPTVFPIIGSSKLSQLLDTLMGADLELNQEEIEAVFRHVI
jgi:aryl-alcohol dehydrogenase-like predicted oxidoreductase